ncbi:MAG: dihydrolipoyl dehydrogenase [Bryobacterales bacterium]|nr:dihydrolipoyl dehydrogenase [Bryobacterales bacterium]
MNSHDLVVIGAGPGGYCAAVRAAQLGLDAACIEREPMLGGTCLRIGCIPSKALLESSEIYERTLSGLDHHGVLAEGVQLDLRRMLRRKDVVVAQLGAGVAGLLKKNRVTRYTGTARFRSPGRLEVSGRGERLEIAAAHIIIATGSRPASLPGIALDGDRIGTSTEALSYPEVPARLAVIGAGYIGLELGSVWRRLGSQVTVFEYLDRILPGMDAEVARAARTIFAKQGLRFRLGSRVTAAKRSGRVCTVETEGNQPFECDRVLVSVGRQANTQGLNLAAAGVRLDDRGRIAVYESFQTSAHGVYAIGDVIRGPMLAHKAEEEGIACVERIATGYGHVNYDAIPGVVYTHPEIASVGKTEEQLNQAGIPFRKGRFPFAANGRARVIGGTEGFAKVLAHAETDRILGLHVIGPRAGDLIAEAAVAIEFGATSEDVARSSHAHPTLAEVLKEASLAVEGRAIHL